MIPLHQPHSLQWHCLAARLCTVTLTAFFVLHAGEGMPDPPRLNFPERASIQEQFEDRVPVVETATVSAG